MRLSTCASSVSRGLPPASKFCRVMQYKQPSGSGVARPQGRLPLVWEGPHITEDERYILQLGHWQRCSHTADQGPSMCQPTGFWALPVSRASLVASMVLLMLSHGRGWACGTLGSATLEEGLTLSAGSRTRVELDSHFGQLMAVHHKALRHASPTA